MKPIYTILITAIILLANAIARADTLEIDYRAEDVPQVRVIATHPQEGKVLDAVLDNALPAAEGVRTLKVDVNLTPGESYVIQMTAIPAAPDLESERSAEFLEQRPAFATAPTILCITIVIETQDGRIVRAGSAKCE